MFLDNHGIKLDMSNRQIAEISPNIWKLEKKNCFKIY